MTGSRSGSCSRLCLRKAVDVVAENARIASHVRSFERSQTFYDWLSAPIQI